MLLEKPVAPKSGHFTHNMNVMFAHWLKSTRRFGTMVAQKGHPSLQIFEVTFCKLAVFQFCTFANMQFVNQALL